MLRRSVLLWPPVWTWFACVGCGPAPEGSAPGDCTDLKDNDWDTLFDCADPDCVGSPDCEESSGAGGNSGGTAPVDSGAYAGPDWSSYPTTTTTVEIPAGRFTMGCTESAELWTCSENETPTVEVTFTRGWLASPVEVTQGLYAQIMGENPAHFPDCGLDCPVEEVDWFDAVSFCNALSLHQGLTPAYTIDGTDVSWDRTADGWRLPTEAEWEYMARAGRSGRELIDAEAAEAWYIDNSQDSPHAVGTRPANPFGLHDIHGNVLEWTWSWYEPYPLEPVTDYAGPPTGDARINRGGGWSSPVDELRTSRRQNDAPQYIIDNVGFRVVRSAAD